MEVEEMPEIELSSDEEVGLVSMTYTDHIVTNSLERPVMTK